MGNIQSCMLSLKYYMSYSMAWRFATILMQHFNRVPICIIARTYGTKKLTLVFGTFCVVTLWRDLNRILCHPHPQTTHRPLPRHSNVCRRYVLRYRCEVQKRWYRDHLFNAYSLQGLNECIFAPCGTNIHTVRYAAFLIEKWFHQALEFWRNLWLTNSHNNRVKY